jgi:predicted transcriptional regulator
VTTTETAEGMIPKGKRLTGDARKKFAAQVVKKYDAGASIRAICDETGRSYGSIHRIVTEAQTAGRLIVRSRGGRTR